MNNAIVICSDSNYFLHATAIIGSLRRQGIANNCEIIIIISSDIAEEKKELLAKKNIKTKTVCDPHHGYHLKYNIFSPEFCIYDNILYLDLDMSIIKNNFDVFGDFDYTIEVDFEPFSLHQTLIQNATNLSCQQLDLLKTIPNKQSWNSGGILFKGEMLYNNIFEKLIEAKNKYIDINYHVRGVKDGGDQPIFNIVLDKYSPRQSKLFSYWKSTNSNTVFAHCCANESDRPWNNSLYIENYKLGLEYFERM